MKAGGLRRKEILQLMIPQDIVPNVLKLVQDAQGSAPPGKDNTIVQARFECMWPGMAKDVGD